MGGVGGFMPQQWPGAPNLFALPPNHQPLPGFFPSLAAPPGLSGPSLIPPFSGVPTPLLSQPSPPPEYSAGLGGLSTPTASAAQRGARRVRARLEGGATHSALDRFSGFDEADSPNGDSSALSGMDTERDGAEKRGGLPG